MRFQKIQTEKVAEAESSEYKIIKNWEAEISTDEKTETDKLRFQL